MLDARRGEVFAALYAPSGERLWGPWVGSPQELCKRASRAPRDAAGRRHRGRYDFAMSWWIAVSRCPTDEDPVHRVSARDVCGLAASGAGGEPLAPIYLRAPDAERWRERDTSKRPE